MPSQRIEELSSRAISAWKDLDVDEASFAHGLVLLLTSRSRAEQQSPLALRPSGEILRREVVVFDDHFSLGPDCSSSKVNADIGLLLISGSEAIWGTVQVGNGRNLRAAAKQVGKLSANIASRTRRGGSSAARYSRNRDGEELAFIRNVAESVAGDLGHCRHLLLAGSAQMRSKLIKELPASMSTLEDASIFAVDSAGLQHLANRAPALAASIQSQHISQVVDRFLEATELESGSSTEVCYGRSQTLAALKLGVVQTLLVADVPQGDDWHSLAAEHKTKLLQVPLTTEVCVKFCDGFRIGALLRYSVDCDLLDLQEEEAEAEAMQQLPSKANEREDDVETASVSSATTTTPSSPSPSRSLCVWLTEALLQVFEPSTAESLAACAEVLLDCEDDEDESLFPSSALESTADLLRSEGVPEEIIAELVARAWDLKEVA